MKKAIVVSFNGTGNAGGVERVSQYICQCLKDSYNVEVLKSTNIHIPKIGFFIEGILMNLRLGFARHDLVISNSWQAYKYPADIVFFHGTMEMFCRRMGKFRKKSAAGLMAYMEKKAAENAGKIIAVSRHVRNELIRLYGIDSNKIFVLPNCVNDKCFQVIDDNITKKNKVILFSGRLEYGKGLQALLALSDYIESIQGWKLYIAANNHQNENLFFGKRNTKVFIGLNTDEMQKFYLNGDVLFFPSLYEGFSMASLEALSCGIPIIGTDYVVTSELADYEFCKNCTDSITSPKKILEVADKLYECWHDKKDIIHKKIQEDFGIQQWKTKFLKLVYND